MTLEAMMTMGRTNETMEEMMTRETKTTATMMTAKAMGLLLRERIRRRPGLEFLLSSAGIRLMKMNDV